MKILLDHIQKTGGTALLDFLRSRLDDQMVSPLILHESIRLAARLFEEFAVVGGHLDLAPDYDWHRGVYHVTVLRNPIERFLSHYSYCREQPDAGDPFARLASRHDIASLLRLEDENVLQTVKDFYICHFAKAFAPPAPTTPAEVFAGIEQRYNLIGISERLDDVARILSIMLGFDRAHVARVRVTGNRLRQADLDPETLILLRDLTAGDRALYELAAARFTSIVRALGGAVPVQAEPVQQSRYQPGHVCADPSPTAARVLATELWCPQSDVNDCALCGADCVLAIQIDPGGSAPDCRIELRVNNALHQVVYRENRLLECLAADDRGPFEVLWHFVCPLGVGLYRCSLAVGTVQFDDVYEFSVVQPPRSPWAGLVDLRPTIEVIGHPDRSDHTLAGSITAAADLLQAVPASLLLLRATISNTGGSAWRKDGITRVVASYKLFDRQGVCLVEDGLRTVLPHSMAPGDTARIELRIKAPAQPGRYSLMPRLVRERVAWFGEGPSIGLQVDAVVESEANLPTPPFWIVEGTSSC